MRALREHFELKVSGKLGRDATDDKQVRILNRTVAWTKDGIEYEPDGRHAELVVKHLKMHEKGVNSVITPGVKEEREDDTPLHGDMCTVYRSLTMRINYLAQDRADLQYAGKELARGMAQPTEGHWQKLKRIGRYLVGRPRLVLKYPFQRYTSNATCFVDSDYAGCLKTRKSTNGGCLMVGQHCVKTWSSNQSVIALSSGEAEFYAMVKGASELLGLMSLAKDLNVSLEGDLRSDSSAAIGMVHRRGLGRVKHMHTQYLWIQEMLKCGDFTVHKESTHDNVADLMTKYLTRAKIDNFLTRLGYCDSDTDNTMALRISSFDRTRKVERLLSRMRSSGDAYSSRLLCSLEKLTGSANGGS